MLVTHWSSPIPGGASTEKRVFKGTVKPLLLKGIVGIVVFGMRVAETLTLSKQHNRVVYNKCLIFFSVCMHERVHVFLLAAQTLSVS